MTPLAMALGGLLLAVLLAVPLFADSYVLSVLTTVLWFAYVGQAWNVMMGFSGLLSLGHALYVGLGAYASAALFVHFGIGEEVAAIHFQLGNLGIFRRAADQAAVDDLFLVGKAAANLANGKGAIDGR